MEAKRAEILQDEVKINLQTHIRVNFWKRTFGNKILYLFYKLARIMFVTVWYYFIPFVAMLGSYLVPIWYAGIEWRAEQAEDESSGDATQPDGE